MQPKLLLYCIVSVSFMMLTLHDAEHYLLAIAKFFVRLSRHTAGVVVNTM